MLHKLSIDKPSFIRKEIVYRKCKSVDSTEFSADICQSSLHTSSAHNITDLVKQYNTALGELADKHAPIITRIVTVRPRAPWYTDEIASAKNLRRKLEHKWLNSKLTVDYMAYKNNSASKLTACCRNPNLSITTVRSIRLLVIKRNYLQF